MGEAKRRNKLSVSSKLRTSNSKKSIQEPKWLYFTKLRIRNYPYIGVATMAIGVIIFLSSGGFNSIN